MEKKKEDGWLKKLLKEERDLEFLSPILEVVIYEDKDIYWTEFYFDDGLVINVLYEKMAEEGKKLKCAVGFKLSVGMEIPQELEEKFKFARQHSKLADEICESFFMLKQEWV